MESHPLETRLGSLDCRSSGHGPAIVFFAGALANHDLWSDVVSALDDRYRCITVDLPLGAHARPTPVGSDRSPASLARLLLECLELLDVTDATVVVNDTAGGLLLLALAVDHPALSRIGRIVLTNCESYEKFPPAQLEKAAKLCRSAPGLARTLVRLNLRSAGERRRTLAAVTTRSLDAERVESFLGPISRDPRIAGDLVAAQAGERPEELLAAAEAIPRFTRPVLLVWGDACIFFPIGDAHRLAADFPAATLVTVPGARTWVPIDEPTAVSDAIASFVPAPAV